MLANPRLKWYALAMALMLVAGGGLMFGRYKEKDYIGGLYARSDFTLLDDAGEFFRLNSLSPKTLALLVFTPDGIPTQAVEPFYAFGRHVDDLRARGIEPFLVSRTHKDIAKNFKRAAHFTARLLLDAGGSVGRNAGVWQGTMPSTTWSYALVDREFHVLWNASADAPIAYDQLMEELRKAR